VLVTPPGAHRGPGFDSHPDRIDALKRPRQTRAKLREPRVLPGEFILIFVRVMGNWSDDVVFFYICRRMKRNSIATRWTGEFILFPVRAIGMTSCFVYYIQVAEIRKVRQVLRQSVGAEGWNLGDAPGVAIVDSFRHEVCVQVLRRSARRRRVRTLNSHRAIPKYPITTQLTLTCNH
jgi:hypothetical protein